MFAHDENFLLFAKKVSEKGETLQNPEGYRQCIMSDTPMFMTQAKFEVIQENQDHWVTLSQLQPQPIPQPAARPGFSPDTIDYQEIKDYVAGDIINNISGLGREEMLNHWSGYLIDLELELKDLFIEKDEARNEQDVRNLERVIYEQNMRILGVRDGVNLVREELARIG